MGSSSSEIVAGYNTFNKVVSSQTALLENDRRVVSYLSSINDGIQSLSDDMKKYYLNQNPQLKGYVVEDLVRGSFNIDALSKRTGEYCWTPPAIDFASVDVQADWGDSFQLKFYNSGKNSAFAQSVTYRLEYLVFLNKLRQRGAPDISLQDYLKQRGIDPNINPDLPVYQAQAALIPTDQIPDAIQSLTSEINMAESRGDFVRAERFRSTLLRLTDRVRSPKGAESLPITEEESRQLAECARMGKFDPSRYDLTLAKKADYLYLCQGIALAGLSSSIVSSVLKAAPDIAKAFFSLIQEGYVSAEDFESIGSQLKTGAKEGFIRGSAVAALKDICALGYFGKELQKAALDISNPTFNNVAVVFVTVMLDTIADSIRKNKGEMSAQEYAYRLEKRIYICGCSVALGTTVQGFMPFAPMLGYVLGSFIGSVLGGVSYEIKEQFFISLCVQKGYTFFGLVEQDYTLPESVLRRIGIKVFEPKAYETSQYSTTRFTTKVYHTKHYKTKTLEYEFLRRGVIGVRRVGYV